MSGTKTILLIDYDPESIRNSRDPLVEAGFKVEVANDGVAGLAAFSSLRPDLVLIEPMVPKKHGFQVCQEIKRSPQGRNVPVLITTAFYKGRRHRSEAKQYYGCDDYLEKPIAAELLLSTCRKFLIDVREPPVPPTVEVEGAATVTTTSAPPPPVVRHAVAPPPQSAPLQRPNEQRTARPGGDAAPQALDNLTDDEIMARLDALIIEEPESDGGATAPVSAGGAAVEPAQRSVPEVVFEADPLRPRVSAPARPAAASSGRANPERATAAAPQAARQVPAARPAPRSAPAKPAPQALVEPIEVRSATPNAHRKSWRFAVVAVVVTVMVLLAALAGFLMFGGKERELAPAIALGSASVPETPESRQEPPPPIVPREEIDAVPRPASAPASTESGVEPGPRRDEPAAAAPPRVESPNVAPDSTVGDVERAAVAAPRGESAGSLVPPASATRASTPTEPPEVVAARPAQSATDRSAAGTRSLSVEPIAGFEPAAAHRAKTETLAKPNGATSDHSRAPVAPPRAEPESSTGAITPPTSIAGTGSAEPAADRPQLTLPPDPAPAPSRARLGDLVEILDVDVQPVALTKAPPDYSAIARKMRREGTVVLRLLVDETGAVTDVQVVTGVDARLLDGPAVRAAKSWTYRPARKDDVAVKVWITEFVTFKL